MGKLLLTGFFFGCLAVFFGYRFHPKIIWNSEFQIELLHDGLEDYHY